MNDDKTTKAFRPNSPQLGFWIGRRQVGIGRIYTGKGPRAHRTFYGIGARVGRWGFIVVDHARWPYSKAGR